MPRNSVGQEFQPEEEHVPFQSSRKIISLQADLHNQDQPERNQSFSVEG